MTDEQASPQVDKTITVETLLVAVQPRLKGFITDVSLNPKCKHDWEAHRVHSAQVKFVFSRLDARTISHAADAGRLIREETTTSSCIRKVGSVI